MSNFSRFTLVLLIALSITACSKKISPTTTTSSTNTSAPAEKADSVQVEMMPDSTLVIKTDSIAVKKVVVKKKVKESIPKVIVVNDQVAKKSVDGRLYYDLKGHRYWRNNKDGKYYLFNKSMNTDDAFKKPNE